MKFSIIIPIYNVERYLKICVDSVLVQNFSNYEIILVNDGSSDNCGQICNEYVEKYPQVQVIHKENGGLSDARNFGIKEAKGDYLIFLDSDDYWKGTNILSDLVTIIDNGNPDMIIHGKTFVFEDGNYKEFPMQCSYQSNNFVADYENLVKEGIYNPTAWNKVVRRDLVFKNNIEFPKGLLHEDISWSFDIAQYTKTYAIYENPFYQYRYGRDGSITNIIKDKNTIAYLDICSEKTQILIKEGKRTPYFKGNLEYWGLSIYAFLEIIIIHYQKNIRNLQKNISTKCKK